MTVSDLIEELRDMDMPNALVYVAFVKNGETVDSREVESVCCDESRGPVYIEGLMK